MSCPLLGEVQKFDGEMTRLSDQTLLSQGRLGFGGVGVESVVSLFSVDS
jgi:hypothetical protein